MPAAPSFSGVWRDDERARAAYAEGAGIYRIVPSAVAVPSTTAALQQVLAWARETGTSLVPRGAGSAMTGSNVGDGVVLDLTVLDGCPLEVNRTQRRAVAGAGVTLGALNEAAGRAGLRLPVEPISSRWATVGGVIGTNAAGPRTVRYGSVRRWVTSLALLTAEGEPVALQRGEKPPEGVAAIRRFLAHAEPAIRARADLIRSAFPKVRKNSTGYALDAYLSSGDLLDLLIGAEGTLGIVTQATWALQPVPPLRAGVRAALRQVERLGALVPALLPLDPSAVEFLDATFLGFVGEALDRAPGGAALREAGAVLMVEFEGEVQDDLDQRVLHATELLQAESLDVQVARGARGSEALWGIRHAASPLLARLSDQKRSLQVIEDACVPVERLGDYVTGVRAAAARHGLDVVLFGHAGDGNVHANLLPDVTRSDWVAGVQALFEEVTGLVLSLGGAPSGEHGDGRLRASVLERIYGPEIVELFRRVKRAFDPRGILNPGVKLGNGEPPFARLKVGNDVARLPDDIAAALRALEQRAGYGLARLDLADSGGRW